MAIGKRLKEQILHVNDPWKYMDLEIVGCNLTNEEKLLSCMVKMQITDDGIKKARRE